MLAVAPVGQKVKMPPTMTNATVGASGIGANNLLQQPHQPASTATNNFEIRSTNDDFAISNNGELEMFKMHQTRPI